MAVFRVERTGDYTVMSNFHLKDKRLSLKAKGLLSQMLSLPDDWDYCNHGHTGSYTLITPQGKLYFAQLREMILLVS